MPQIPPYYPVETYTYVCMSALLLLPTTITLVCVLIGSRSVFALKLIAFVYGYIVCYIALALCNWLTPPGRIYQNFFAWETVNGVFFLLSLQIWVFAMQYLGVAQQCASYSSCLKRLPIDKIEKWVSTVYVMCVIAITGTILMLFPGYEVPETYYSWYDAYGRWFMLAVWSCNLALTVVATSFTFYATLCLLRFVRTLTGNRQDLGFNKY